MSALSSDILKLYVQKSPHPLISGRRAVFPVLASCGGEIFPQCGGVASSGTLQSRFFVFAAAAFSPSCR